MSGPGKVRKSDVDALIEALYAFAANPERTKTKKNIPLLVGLIAHLDSYDLEPSDLGSFPHNAEEAEIYMALRNGSFTLNEAAELILDYYPLRRENPRAVRRWR